jgi:hypothetical protein
MKKKEYCHQRDALNAEREQKETGAKDVGFI